MYNYFEVQLLRSEQAAVVRVRWSKTAKYWAIFSPEKSTIFVEEEPTAHTILSIPICYNVNFSETQWIMGVFRGGIPKNLISHVDLFKNFYPQFQ